MDKQIEDIEEALDDLTICNLELIEKRVAANIKMEQSLRNAQIELAKTRLLRGKENIGVLQIPVHSDVSPLFKLETVLSNKADNKTPQFDISLKQKEDIEKVQNPLKWFGILVPQSLKLSQKHFQEAVYHSVEIANIQAQHITLLKKIKVLKGMQTKSSITEITPN